MPKPDAWMPLYVADYRADTTRLSTEQHGAYLLILIDYWRNGPPPDDDRVLSQITGLTLARWKAHRPVIGRFFTIDGVWRQKRADKERDKAAGNVTAKQAAGQSGAAAKWGCTPDNKMKRSERLAAARAIASHTPAQWAGMLDICSNACVRCGSVLDLVKDHIKPIYQGGSDGIENIQPLCRSCNSSKGADSSDLRPPDCLKTLGEMPVERLTERLTDACPMPAPSPSPSPTTKSKALSGKPDDTPLNGRNYTAEARDILDYLNRATGRGYRHVDSNLKPIVARLKSGVTPTQVREVVFAKCEQWGKDEKMMTYLRPETLFRASKFEQYLGEMNGMPAVQG